jgi:hypothetical protein
MLCDNGILQCGDTIENNSILCSEFLNQPVTNPLSQNSVWNSVDITIPPLPGQGVFSNCGVSNIFGAIPIPPPYTACITFVGNPLFPAFFNSHIMDASCYNTIRLLAAAKQEVPVTPLNLIWSDNMTSSPPVTVIITNNISPQPFTWISLPIPPTYRKDGVFFRLETLGIGWAVVPPYAVAAAEFDGPSISF